MSSDGLDEPRLFVQLGLELPRRPAGVAGEDASTPRRLRELVEIAVGPREAEVADDDRCGLRRLVELGEDEHRPGLHRPADEDERVGPCDVGQIGHRLAHRRLGRPVEDEPHRAVLSVLRDEHHRPAEVRVEERRRREEQHSLQRLDAAHVTRTAALRGR